MSSSVCNEVGQGVGRALPNQGYIAEEKMPEYMSPTSLESVCSDEELLLQISDQTIETSTLKPKVLKINPTVNIMEQTKTPPTNQNHTKMKKLII